MLGVNEYVKNDPPEPRRRAGATSALFTKYPTAHFAYALKPKLVMQYSNDGWGPDNIDRVFTHESGHIFGCPDEYASSGCNCTPSSATCASRTATARTARPRSSTA